MEPEHEHDITTGLTPFEGSWEKDKDFRVSMWPVLLQRFKRNVASHCLACISIEEIPVQLAMLACAVISVKQDSCTQRFTAVEAIINSEISSSCISCPSSEYVSK